MTVTPETTMAEPARPAWHRRAKLPLPTVYAFLALAVALWLNAAINHYRFNVVLAVLGSVPLIVLLALGAAKGRKPAA